MVAVFSLNEDGKGQRIWDLAILLRAFLFICILVATAESSTHANPLIPRKESLILPNTRILGSACLASQYSIQPV